jgi:hypothetical protein
MPGVTLFPPEGTYTLFPRVNHHGLSPEALVERLRDRHRVAVVPGSPRWFGPGAEGHLRLVFSTSEAILREGLARLERGLVELAGEERQGGNFSGTETRPARATGNERGSPEKETRKTGTF